MEIRRTAIINLFRKRGRVIALAGLFIFAVDQRRYFLAQQVKHF